MTTECSVCCEPLNRAARKEVVCTGCNYQACMSCVKQFLLGTTLDPHCMNCKLAWSRDFWMSALPTTWLLKEYKEHRENLLYERELSLLPATQPMAEYEKIFRDFETNRKALNVERMKIEKEIKTMLKEEYSVRTVKLATEMRKRINAITEEIANREKARDEAVARYRLKHGVLPGTTEKSKPTVSEGPRYTLACPEPDCRGFLDLSYCCGTCNVKVCKECREPLKEGHVCMPENVATTKMLKSDSKPCPKCATLIFKISGCDQMWCTQCHTAFSWNTGRVELDLIHNPHYYEYLRKTKGSVPRNPADFPCGGVPTAEEVFFIMHQHGLSTKVDRQVYAVGTARDHNRWMFRDWDPTDTRTNEKLRINYLLNELSKDGFKRELQKADKRRAFRSEIYQIGQMYLTASDDILVKFRQVKDAGGFVPIVKEQESLVSYVNEQMERVAKTFKMKAPYIEADSFRLEY